ncbi:MULTISPECIES: helix-turn-helix transcriptional regulator [Rhizobium/Agrobacterium group]|uniref:helix-turn-helix domain-containing protein n=1 Tax=Rhizobium/Agrobacterium group TaxID=227290 RepID=UPI003297B1EC
MAQFHLSYILLVLIPTYRTWTRVVCHEQIVGMEPFARNLRLRAAKLGISNAEVARRADLSDRRYGNYVSGRREPDLATLIRISRVLGVSVDELVGSTVEKRTESKEHLLQERIEAALRTLDHDDLQRLAIMVEALAVARTPP